MKSLELLPPHNSPSKAAVPKLDTHMSDSDLLSSATDDNEETDDDYQTFPRLNGGVYGGLPVAGCEVP